MFKADLIPLSFCIICFILIVIYGCIVTNKREIFGAFYLSPFIMLFLLILAYFFILAANPAWIFMEDINKDKLLEYYKDYNLNSTLVNNFKDF